MLHKMSFSKNSRHYLLYTQEQQQPGNSYVRAEFQLCHPVVQSMYLTKAKSTTLSQPIKAIHVDLTQSCQLDSNNEQPPSIQTI